MTNTENYRKYNVEFEVVKEDLTPLLSRKPVEQMKLITVNYDNFKQSNTVASDHLASILAQYNDVFDDKVLGQFPAEAHLHVREYANPVQIPARRIPVSVKRQLKKELSNLVKQGVLEPVSEPPKWCSQISVQSKKNW